MAADPFAPPAAKATPFADLSAPSDPTADATLLIRSDASNEIGAGHIMRCIALAQEWQARGGAVTVAANQLTESARARIADNEIKLADIGLSGEDFRAVADAAEPAWIVLDVGPLVHEYLAALAECHNVLAIDDLGGHFPISPTLILNQNAHGPVTEYSGVKPGRLLRGLDYLLLRNEFLQACEPDQVRATDNQQSTVLVVMGGTDPLQLLPDLVDTLASSAELAVCAVASSRHPQLERLRILDRQNDNVALHLDVSNMAHLIKRCDLALTSGGTTVWELAYMGVPAIVGAVAEVERQLLVGLDRIKLFRTIGSLDQLNASDIAEIVIQVSQDQEWLTATRARANEVIDGQGRRRVIDQMRAEGNNNLTV